jgi:hypothetical protein
LKGVFVNDIIFTIFDEPGVYDISLVVTDIRGNERTLGPDDLAAKGFQNQFILIGTMADVEAPQLIEISISPVVVFPFEFVEINLTISDNASGFSFGSLLFQGPLGEDGIPLFEAAFFGPSQRYQ